MDAETGGARIVAVHVPGPGCTAGLVSGDVLLTSGRTGIDPVTDLARAVGGDRPGPGVTLTVRHRSGTHQQLTVVPAVVVRAPRARSGRPGRPLLAQRSTYA